MTFVNGKLDKYVLEIKKEHDDNNVGKSKNGDGYHLYDITKKVGKVAKQNNALERVNNDLRSEIDIPTNNNIPQNEDIVNSEDMQIDLNNATESDIPSFEDFRETVLKEYPNMLEYDIREAYNNFYGLTNNGANDIIDTDDVYYQRRGTDAEQQGRNNGDGNQQGGYEIEGSDTVRTEGNKFRDGREYRTGRAGLWQKTYGRVSRTLKKTTTRYIKQWTYKLN